MSLSIVQQHADADVHTTVESDTQGTNDPEENTLHLMDLPCDLLRYLLRLFHGDLHTLLRLAGSCAVFRGLIYSARPLWKDLDFGCLPPRIAAQLTDADLAAVLTACDSAGTVVHSLSIRGCVRIDGRGLQAFLLRTTVLEEVNLRVGLDHHCTAGPTGFVVPESLCAALLRLLMFRKLREVKFRRQRRSPIVNRFDALQEYDAPYYAVMSQVAINATVASLFTQSSCMGCGEVVLAAQQQCAECEGATCRRVNPWTPPPRDDGCPTLFACYGCDAIYCTRCRHGGICSACKTSHCTDCRPSLTCALCGLVSCETCTTVCRRCNTPTCTRPCFYGDVCHCCAETLCHNCDELMPCYCCSRTTCVYCTQTCGNCFRRICAECAQDGEALPGTCVMCRQSLCTVCTDFHLPRGLHPGPKCLGCAFTALRQQ